jgi:pimeloyl-ACP methyl ester carboxylesterase
MDPARHVILGHSFGGKVALSSARISPAGLRQVWAIDSTPAPGRTAAGASDILALLRRLPRQFRDRRAAVHRLQEGGFDRTVAEWMATNLTRTPDGYGWRFSITDMEELLADYFRDDEWPVVEAPPPGLELIFIRAGRDSILDDRSASRLARMQRSDRRVRLVTLPGGHWLNMDNPKGLLDLLRTGLPRM